MYGLVPLFGLVTSVLFIVISQTINVVSIHNTSISHKNCLLSKAHWKFWLMSRLVRMQLRSCPPFGYTVGFVRNVRVNTSIDVADNTVNLIVTFSLMNS